MKQKDVKFIKEKFQIDITNYNKIEQKNILSIIENYISKEIELNNKINQNKKNKLKQLLKELKNTLIQ